MIPKKYLFQQRKFCLSTFPMGLYLSKPTTTTTTDNDNARVTSRFQSSRPPSSLWFDWRFPLSHRDGVWYIIMITNLWLRVEYRSYLYSTLHEHPSLFLPCIRWSIDHIYTPPSTNTRPHSALRRVEYRLNLYFTLHETLLFMISLSPLMCKLTN